MTQKHLVVGIGSSTGGLEALKLLFERLESISNCTFIIAQHLTNSSENIIYWLLKQYSNIPVHKIYKNTKIKKNIIYITPTSSDIYIKNKCIYLKNTSNNEFLKPSINCFFSSLAQEYKQNAIGIILSGESNDGALGLKQINLLGGISIVEDPNTAICKQMPEACINEGIVDIVLPANKIANILKNLTSSINTIKSTSNSKEEQLKEKNKKLSFVNSQLKIYNEELQTSYSELRILHENINFKFVELEELVRRLSLEIEELRKSKELIVQAVNLAPIAIMKLNKNGEIDFVNNEILKLFSLAKKDLYLKTYDSNFFKIKSINNEKIKSSNLPFSIIKKSLEPVYDFYHILELENKNLLLRLNASPLFDLKGAFQGAVISFESINKTKVIDNNGFEKNNIDLVELLLLESAANFKNSLNNLSLKLSLLKDSDSQAIEDLQNTILEYSKKYNLNIKTYLESINNEKIKLLKIIKDVLNTFKPIFEEQDINLQLNFTKQDSINISYKKSKEALLYLIDFIFKIKKKYFFTRSLVIKVSFDKLSVLSFVIDSKFKNINICQKQIDIFSKTLKNLNIKLFSDLKNGILIKVDFYEN